MSYPELTPIIAKGATKPRYLEDRFADVVNVKDFGAKGDGITDDTAAFVAAGATSRPVFVPGGTYNVSQTVNGEFWSLEDVVVPNNQVLRQGYNIVVYQTKAELSSDLMKNENTLAFVTNDSTVSNRGWYIKVGTSGTGSWSHFTYDYLTAYIKSTGTLINSENAQTVCNGSLGNLPTGTICTVNYASGINDLPVKKNGLVTTLSRSSDRQDGSTGYNTASSQLYITEDHLFRRYYATDYWGKWKTSVPMECMNILGVGDSICSGVRNEYRGYVGELGLPYANYGISSWRLSNTREGYGPIASQLDTFAADAADPTKDVYGFVPDVIIGEGGINDYTGNVPLGTVPTSPVDATPDTVVGGLQHLFYKMITMYPYAQRLFVIVHKMGTPDGTKYYPTDENSAGYTQEDMVEAMLATCKVYGVKPVDVYHEGQMDTSFNAYLGDWAADHSSSAWCNIDRCHPLHNGYVNVYCPLIWQALTGGTKKA